MRAIVQRVRQASVAVAGREVSRIGPGLLVLLGVGQGDTEQDAVLLAERVVHLRIFADGAGHMNLSAVDVRGAVLVVSQFTLYGDARKGRRPSFVQAAQPVAAERLYRCFVDAVRASGLAVAEGVFRAEMDVSLVNQGPVTILLDSGKAF